MSLKIKKIGIPSIMTDNDIQYLNYIFLVIEKIDEDSNITIRKSLEGYNITINNPDVNYRNILVKEIKEAHYLLGLTIEFSKSLKISKSISWFVK